MKITAIGDIHGIDIWKKIVETERDSDQIVFVGDYLDSFHVPSKTQVNNFLQILDSKRKNPDKITLLLGNHDFHYLPEANGERYSGYNPITQLQVGELLREAWQKNDFTLIKNSYFFYPPDQELPDDKVFIRFSHAGCTDTWIQSWEHEEFDIFPQYFYFKFGKRTSLNGDDITQSPFWVRPRSLLADASGVCTQVVGHTVQERLHKAVSAHGTDVWFIDTLETSGEYLVIQDDEFIIKKA